MNAEEIAKELAEVDKKQETAKEVEAKDAPQADTPKEENGQAAEAAQPWYQTDINGLYKIIHTNVKLTGQEHKSVEQACQRLLITVNNFYSGRLRWDAEKGEVVTFTE